MGELMNVDGKQVISSLHLAEITGKNHFDILKAIRSMEDAWIGLGQSKFTCTYYLDKSNRESPMFELTKIESLYVVTKFNDEARGKVILRWEEIEKEKQTTQQLPTTYLEALKDLVAKEEKIILLQARNEKLQFRSDFVDVAFETDGLFSMEEVCKINDLPYGRNTMLSKLRAKRVFLSSNTPSQKLINAGYFKVVEQIIEVKGFKKLISTTFATQKGLAYIYKILKSS